MKEQELDGMEQYFFNRDLYDENGYNPCTGLYKSRYYAKKAAYGDEVVVYVGDGYKVMKVTDWIVWKKQR